MIYLNIKYLRRGALPPRSGFVQRKHLRLVRQHVLVKGYSGFAMAQTITHNFDV